MNFDSSQNLPIFFPFIFLFMWLVVTTILGAVSGWFTLMKTYPNRVEAPLLALRNQSGSLGSVSMRNILVLGVCPSGLRIGIMRIFGPFCRDFFVPWEDIRVQRRERMFWRIAELEFARQAQSKLSIPEHVANRLAASAAGRWPEPGPVPDETDSGALSRIAKRWLLSTTLAAAFFIIAPRIVAPTGAHPPIVVAILFPAIVFGLGAVIQYIRKRNA